MPTWIWPQERKAETTTAIRFGRVLHWLATAIGCFTIALAVFFAYDSYSTSVKSQADHSAWVKRHPPPPAGYDQIATKIGADLIVDDPDPEPYPTIFDPYAPLGIALTGIIILLAGRCFRYVIADE